MTKESDMLKRLREFLNSPEGLESAQKYFGSIRAREVIKDSQVERAYVKYDSRFDEILTRIQNKYDSDTYRNKWYSKGIEPSEDLYWFVFEYAKQHGREATEKEYEIYGNMFTSELYFIHGYFFNLMNGQGSAIVITKI